MANKESGYQTINNCSSLDTSRLPPGEASSKGEGNEFADISMTTAPRSTKESTIVSATRTATPGKNETKRRKVGSDAEKLEWRLAKQKWRQKRKRKEAEEACRQEATRFLTEAAAEKM